MSAIVRQPGVLTTVQDLGRVSWQHIGVPVGGAMDSVAQRLGNALVGNDENAATLECTMGGTAIQFDAPALIALAGRNVTASLDGTPIPAWHAIRVHTDALLAIHTGFRTTLAIAGGVDVPPVLGSRSTCLRAVFGGWHGRALRRDDRLPIAVPTATSVRMMEHLQSRDRTIGDWSIAPSLLPAYSADATVRFIPGPQFDELSDKSRDAFCSHAFRIASESDRMGFRLTGSPLSLREPREMLSTGVTAGTIQLPSGGAPIVLMADRQTTGGYPRIADVISVDIPVLAQLLPGDNLRFTVTTLASAHTAYLAREHSIAQAYRALQLRYTQGINGSS